MTYSGALGPTVFGDSMMGRGMEILLILSVLSSAAASTQTTILPTARTTLAMGAYKALPATFAKIHPRYLTPSVATIWMGAVSILFYMGLTLVSENVLADSIAAVGLMIAFYYGLTGFAAVWFYRHDLTKSINNFFMKGLLPFLGDSCCWVPSSSRRCSADPEYGSTTLWGIGGVFILGIGALLLGVVFMVIWERDRPALLRGETLDKRHSGDLVLSGEPLESVVVGLPDSGLPDLVIAPDLSNLPGEQRHSTWRPGSRWTTPENCAPCATFRPRTHGRPRQGPCLTSAPRRGVVRRGQAHPPRGE